MTAIATTGITSNTNIVMTRATKKKLNSDSRIELLEGKLVNLRVMEKEELPRAKCHYVA
jgi:hypothetical protein